MELKFHCRDQKSMPFNQNLYLPNGIVCLEFRYALSELHMTLVQKPEGLMPQ